MAKDGTRERVSPRTLLVEQSAFGKDPAATWKPLGDTDLEYVVAAYWHHLATCAINERFPVRPEDELGRRLGIANLTYFKRQFSGELRVSIDELCVWAITLDDVSILPHFDSATDLYPPGMLPDRP